MGEEGLEWRIHALCQDVCDLRSDLFCPWAKRKLRAFDGRKVFCFILRLPQAPTRRHAARSGGKTHPAPLVAVACSQCPVLGKAARTFGKLQMRESPRNLRIPGANFMGVTLRKHSSPGCSGMTHCDLLPRKEAGCQHAKARRVSSSRSLAARMSWAERCGHRSATPPFCLLLRKAAGGSKERQIAKTAIPGDIGLFSAAEASMEFPAGLADRWF